MKIINILDNNTIKLPKIRDVSQIQIKKAIPNFISDHLENYIQHLEQIDNFPIKRSFDYFQVPNNQFLIETVKTISQGIRSSLIKYLDGKQHKAYLILKELFKKKIVETYVNFNPFKFHQEKYYRIFYNIENHKITKSLLFHIPFDLIENVSAQRFSIPGFPCLYLGNSVLTCVKELNLHNQNAELQSIVISKFKFTNIIPIKILDLTIKTELFKESYKNNNFNYESFFVYLLIFPLILSSSIPVLFPEKPFKPEYIIPQLLLQWIRTDMEPIFDGIKYSSTKDKNNSKLINLVMCPRGVSPQGQCNYLRQLFNQTEPKTFLELLGNENKDTKLDQENYEKICQKIENQLAQF